MVYIVTGTYDTVVSPTILAAGSSHATRGRDFRLQKIMARYDLHYTISLTSPGVLIRRI